MSVFVLSFTFILVQSYEGDVKKIWMVYEFSNVLYKKTRDAFESITSLEVCLATAIPGLVGKVAEISKSRRSGIWKSRLRGS